MATPVRSVWHITDPHARTGYSRNWTTASCSRRCMSGSGRFARLCGHSERRAVPGRQVPAQHAQHFGTGDDHQLRAWGSAAGARATSVAMCRAKTSVACSRKCVRGSIGSAAASPPPCRDPAPRYPGRVMAMARRIVQPRQFFRRTSAGPAPATAARSHGRPPAAVRESIGVLPGPVGCHAMRCRGIAAWVIAEAPPAPAAGPALHCGAAATGRDGKRMAAWAATGSRPSATASSPSSSPSWCWN